MYAMTDRNHSARYWETGRDAGSTDNLWCPVCKHPDYQCSCPCECGCSCKLKVQCECTCQSAHRRQCTRKNGRKCECYVTCSCKCRCDRTRKHMMDRDLRKVVQVWDPETGARRPAIINGQEVLQTHGYSPMRSYKFGTAKKTATRWHRPTEDAAIGKPDRGMWEGDDYETLNMTTAQLAAFTVAHKFVMNRVPDYKGQAKQGTLEAMLAGAKGRDDTHSVRMFTPQDLRKMGKRLPKKLKKGILRPYFGDN